MDRQEAIQIIKNNWPNGRHMLSEALEFLIPELKESEDERVRKRLIEIAKTWKDGGYACGNDDEIDDILTWLKKQGEQTSDKIVEKARTEKQRVLLTETDGSANIDWDCRSLEDARRLLECGLKYINTELVKQCGDKVEPKFKVGDIIINGYGFIMQIDGIDGNMYVYHVLDGNIPLKHDITKTEESCHLWTIQDAKDGDVLANKNGAIFINAGSLNGKVTLDCYCYISVQNKFCIEEHKTGSWLYKDDVKPATKEQRDTLFQKMEEAGYEWDAEKKKLKKIEQDPVAYFYCKYGGMIPKCSDCKRNHLNSKYERTEIKTWMIPASRSTKQCSDYIQKNPTWREDDERLQKCLIEDQEKYLEEVRNNKVGHSEIISDLKEMYRERIDWLKSLRQRMKGE